MDARYGALGVLDESGTRLDQFITVGLDDETYRAIGPLPEGHGILGLLIVAPGPPVWTSPCRRRATSSCG